MDVFYKAELQSPSQAAFSILPLAGYETEPTKSEEVHKSPSQMTQLAEVLFVNGIIGIRPFISYLRAHKANLENLGLIVFGLVSSAKHRARVRLTMQAAFPLPSTETVLSIT